MANFTFSSGYFTTGIKMGSQDFDFVVGNGSGTFSTTSLVFTNGTDTATFTGTNLQTVTFFGFLTDITAGDLTGLNVQIGGSTALDITGWNISAVEVYDLVVAEAWPQLWNLMVSGNDTVTGTTFNDKLIGGAGRDSLWGDKGRDFLFGGGSNDTLNGGDGHDVLTGNTGADRFVFSSRLNAGHSDTITDFVSGLDKIALDHDVFTTVAVGNLAGARFVLGTEAGDSNDRVIYDQPTGDLYFDRDGTGTSAQVLIANLGAGTALAATDFLIIP